MINQVVADWYRRLASRKRLAEKSPLICGEIAKLNAPVAYDAIMTYRLAIP